MSVVNYRTAKKCSIKAVKIYVEFHDFLCIIKVAEIIMKSRKELKEYGKYFTSIGFEKL